MNPKYIGLIVDVLGKASAFVAGSPITIAIPAESYPVQIPDFGEVVVSESGTTLTVQKK